MSNKSKRKKKMTEEEKKAKLRAYAHAYYVALRSSRMEDQRVETF